MLLCLIQLVCGALASVLFSIFPAMHVRMFVDFRRFGLLWSVCCNRNLQLPVVMLA